MCTFQSSLFTSSSHTSADLTSTQNQKPSSNWFHWAFGRGRFNITECHAVTEQTEQRWDNNVTIQTWYVLLSSMFVFLLNIPCMQSAAVCQISDSMLLVASHKCLSRWQYVCRVYKSTPFLHFRTNIVSALGLSFQYYSLSSLLKGDCLPHENIFIAMPFCLHWFDFDCLWVWVMLRQNKLTVNYSLHSNGGFRASVLVNIPEFKNLSIT